MASERRYAPREEAAHDPHVHADLSPRHERAAVRRGRDLRDVPGRWSTSWHVRIDCFHHTRSNRRGGAISSAMYKLVHGVGGDAEADAEPDDDAPRHERAERGGGRHAAHAEHEPDLACVTCDMCPHVSRERDTNPIWRVSRVHVCHVSRASTRARARERGRHREHASRSDACCTAKWAASTQGRQPQCMCYMCCVALLMAANVHTETRAGCV